MSTISAGTTSGTALVSSGDTTGQLVLQTNGTTTAVTIGTNQVVTLAQPLPVASGGTGATSLASAGILTTSAAVTVAQGGTGSTSLTANNVLLGNGTSALQTVAPGSNGNVLTSNGTTWTSAAPPVEGATALGSVSIYRVGPSNSTADVRIITSYASNNLFTKPFKSATTDLMADEVVSNLYCVSYSSYYNGWFGVFGLPSSVNTSAPLPVFSADGLTWTPVISTIDRLNGVGGTGVAAIGANDSNGNIYLINTSNVMYVSTDNGTTWTNLGNVDYNVTGGGTAAYRYLNSGTASTSRSAFFYRSLSNTSQMVVNSAPGNSNTFSRTLTGSDYPDVTAPWSITTYGTKAAIMTPSNVVMYQGTDNTITVTTHSTLGLSGEGTFAFNDSFWCAPSSAGFAIRHGTISGITPSLSGTINFTAYPSATGQDVQFCVYDGSRWFTITTQGMFSTSNANPNTGWLRAPVNLGLTIDSLSGTTRYRTYLNQRDVVR